jgi:hypothetical protein
MPPELMLRYHLFRRYVYGKTKKTVTGKKKLSSFKDTSPTTNQGTLKMSKLCFEIFLAILSRRCWKQKWTSIWATLSKPIYFQVRNSSISSNV